LAGQDRGATDRYVAAVVVVMQVATTTPIDVRVTFDLAFAVAVLFASKGVADPPSSVEGVDACRAGGARTLVGAETPSIAYSSNMTENQLRVESHCETSKFGLSPTGGQVVAGSNSVSPTQHYPRSKAIMVDRGRPRWVSIGVCTATRTAS
jgi:hypothetical protein